MKHIKTFRLFEGKEEWDQLAMDTDTLVELALELEYSINGPFSVSDVDEMRKEYKEKGDKELLRMISQYLSCAADEESIIKSLKEIYPHGYILHDNNEFHQFGGEEA